MQRGAFLALALGLCLCTANAWGDFHYDKTSGNRRRLMDGPEDGPGYPPATSPCWLDPTGNSAPWYGKCAINPLWLVKQKAHSRGAKADIDQAKFNLACAKHLPPTNIGDAVEEVLMNNTANLELPSDVMAGISACNGDTANYCYVDLFVTGDVNTSTVNCASYRNAGFLAAGLLCKDAPYADFIDCLSKPQSQCTGKCAWNTEWRNQTSPPYLVLDALSKYALQRGYSCVPAEIVNYNITELRTYSEEVDVERGNCSYAVNAQQRVKYANTCASFNNPDMITGIMQGYVDPETFEDHFDGINATLANQCLSAGCEIQRIPAAVGWTGYSSDWFVCNTYMWKYNAMKLYSQQDVTLLRATRQCSQPEKVYDKMLCESTVLVPY